MLRSQISLSEQVNDMSLKSTLLFTWLIAHVDDFGRILANPKRLKALIFPLRDDISVDDIKESLIDMYDHKLAILYMIEDNVYLELTKFDNHQGGLHKRTASKIPPPEAASHKGFDVFPGNSGKFREIPGDSPRIEQNRNRIELVLTSPEGEVMSGKPDVPPLQKNSEIKKQAREILSFLNSKTGKEFRMVDTNLNLIMARLKSGATVLDCRQVIAKKTREWKGNEQMVQYLRPSTLFNATKFEQYVGELVEE